MREIMGFEMIQHNYKIKSNLPEQKIDVLELVNYVENVSIDYTQTSKISECKLKGQFFTSPHVAKFMAGLFNQNKKEFSVLDPGAGIGMLSAAFCEKILYSPGQYSICLDAYETDHSVIPLLEKVLKYCQSKLREKGDKFEYRIIEKDFILNNPHQSKRQLCFEEQGDIIFYDYIISNPPYFKLNKKSLQSIVMKEFISGQPNIYSFFMALSLEMLKQNGEMVFITPRSFCSGLYFKKFRHWLLKNSEIKNIHLFESRSDVFNKKEVLQENVIIKFKKKFNEEAKSKVIISTSRDNLFQDLKKTSIDYCDVLHQIHKDTFIKIPTTQADIKIQHIINKWEYTLRDFGMKVSTGPVVSFRAKEYLSPEFDAKLDVPLLWMHNIKDMNVVWPIHKKNKEKAVKMVNDADYLLLPVKNYVLVKRFSSKEQKRRLYAGVMLMENFKFDKIGIENHLNYIYRTIGSLSKEEAYGIAAIINSTILDIYFRMLNGNTQVNALDIANFPLPPLDKIKTIGALIKQKKYPINNEVDKIIIDVLEIKENFNDLNGGHSKDEKEN